MRSGWDSAHVLGTSLGGMIAQAVAIEHPDRVRSLTSVMSTPAPWLGLPTRRAAAALLAAPARSPDEAAERAVATFRVIGSPGYPLDEDWLRAYARRAFARGAAAGADAGSARRQLAAAMGSPGRLGGLRAAPRADAGGARRGRPADPSVRGQGARARRAGRTPAHLSRNGPQPARGALADDRGCGA